MQPYLFIASMDVDAEHEEAFHTVYDTEHVPYLAEVRGVLSIRRYELQPFSIHVGGKVVDPPIEDEPRFTAIYEVAGPEVLTSPGWVDAIDRGRWADDVRPFTSRRRHRLLRPLA
jgi:hypothetical protein